MAWASLKLNPGINTELTPLLNEAGWSQAAGIRWRDGLPEKTGGYAHINNSPFIGTATGLHAWSALDTTAYLALGTEQFLYSFYAGTLFNITPIRAVDNVAVNFSTVINTPTVTIVDSANGSAAGDWVNIVVPVSVGGLVLQGYYPIQTIVDANTYTITAPSNATATVNNGGAVPTFQTFNTNVNVTVVLNNHGLVVNNQFAVQVSLSIGGFTLLGSYAVTSVVDANTFKIQPGGGASGNHGPTSENSGNAQLSYQLPSGLASSEYLTSGGGGYGVGDYGAGPYGVSTTGTQLVQLRGWSLDNFGQDLVANYIGSPFYIWVPSTSGGAALLLNSTNFPGATDWPTAVNYSFVSAPQQMVIALGANDIGTSNFDPLLVRWCDIGDFTDWTPSVSNAAGSYRIPTGSALTGGISAPNFTAIWTDIDMWLMIFLGGAGTNVWGFQKIASGVDLLSYGCAAVYQNRVYWPSPNGFFVFDGNAVNLIPCPVWDIFWRNLNHQQAQKVKAAVNSGFQEISWHFPSASGNGSVDSRVTYNLRENTWSYDIPPTTLARTAWVDGGAGYGAPIGCDLNGYLQQQDSHGNYDADGAPLPASVRSGWFSLDEGTYYIMIERFFADLIVKGANPPVQLTVYFQDYPLGPVTTYGPFNWNTSSGPPYSRVRGRGRFASFQISSSVAGVFWRLGNVRYGAAKAGTR